MRFLVPLILPCALALLAAPGPAARAADTVIMPEQTSGLMGQCMTVEGRVSLRPSPGRLGMDLAFDSANGFVAYVPHPASLGDLGRLDGQTLHITGIIEPGLTGLTQIQLTSPEQIMRADETPDRLITCDHF